MDSSGGNLSYEEREKQLLAQISLFYHQLGNVRQEKASLKQQLEHGYISSENSKKKGSNRIILVTRRLPFKLRKLDETHNPSNNTPTNSTTINSANLNSMNSQNLNSAPLPFSHSFFASSPDSVPPPPPSNSTFGDSESAYMNEDDEYGANNYKKTTFRFTNGYRADYYDFDLDEALQNFICLHQNYSCVWLGSLSHPTSSEVMTDQVRNNIREQLYHDHKYFPVFLDPKKESLFYSGYCKTVMWPLFHSSPPTTEDQILTHDSETSDEDKDIEKMWQAYVGVNQNFADAIQEIYEDGDLIWIQGYHFTLLPQMLRNLLPTRNIHIGYFLHIPFPSSELYRITSRREEMLYGMLEADLIGFQTYEYARHFQSACVRILGLDSNHKGVHSNGHFARVGIDAERFINCVQSRVVQDKIEDFSAQYQNKKLVLGIDRLDPSKGLIHKFLAMEEIFQVRPELAKHILFLQIVVTPTTTVDYSKLESQIDAMVTRINSKLQDIGGEGPIQYLTREVSLEELIALYCVSDILLTTPLRDGMNMVPFEYVVCREAHQKNGIVILSEFAGCAQSLSGAILVNPWDTESVQNAILNALVLEENTEKEQDRIRNHQYMFQYASSFTSKKWAQNFVEQLKESSEDEVPVSGRELSRREIVSAYARSNRRLFFLNYEGVLAKDNSSIPELANPSLELRHLLMKLTKSIIVVLVSGRSAVVMEKWFGDIEGLILAAEYGVYIRWSITSPWKCVMPNLDLSWWEDVSHLLEYYTERTPGAYIEKKESSVMWHYRDCDLDHGFWQAAELQVSLRELTRSAPISIVPGDKCLDIRPQLVSKAALFERIWEYVNLSEKEVNLDICGVNLCLSPSRSPRRHSDASFSFGNAELQQPIKSRISSPSKEDSQSNGGDEKVTKVSEIDSTVDTENVKQPDIDFLLVITCGENRTDEDLFASLVPPPVDLQDYCKVLEFEEETRRDQPVKQKFSNRQEKSVRSHENEEQHSHSSRNNVEGLLLPEGGRTSSLIDKIISSTNRKAIDDIIIGTKHFSSLNPPLPALYSSPPKKQLSKKRCSNPSSMFSQNNVPTPPAGSQYELATTTATVSGEYVGEGLATKLPSSALASAKRDVITEQSKFKPRKDFPPSAALFIAMQKKFGDNFGISKLPESPAECWALVLPPRRKMGDHRSDSSTSLQQLAMINENTTNSALLPNEVIPINEFINKEEPLNEINEEILQREQTTTSNITTTSTSNTSAIERNKLPLYTYVCRVGKKISQAPYYVKTVENVINLLDEIGNICSRQQNDVTAANLTITPPPSPRAADSSE